MQLMHNGEGLPSLNKRRELFSTCPHKRIYLLLNLKSEEKKSSKRQCTKRKCTKTFLRGRTKMAARNRPVEAQNVGRSRYKISNMLLNIVEHFILYCKKRTLSLSIYLSIYLSLSLSLSIYIYIYRLGYLQQH